MDFQILSGNEPILYCQSLCLCDGKACMCLELCSIQKLVSLVPQERCDFVSLNGNLQSSGPILTVATQTAMAVL